jgi:NTE family protein
MERGGAIGIALGSGAARGWAHIGVIRALEEAGIEPEIVCGSSIGAVVGAVYAAGELDAFEAWVRALDWRRVFGYLDLSWGGGGFLKARKVFDAMAEHFPDRAIGSLTRRFAAVATDLGSGREIWLQEGSVMDAMRASVALPGIVTPVRREGRWLVDGGLVNPVPVALCRALGARRVIAVDLNTTLLSRRFKELDMPPPEASGSRPPGPSEEPLPGVMDAAPGSLRDRLQLLAAELRQRLGDDGGEEEPGPSAPSAPSIFEVMANSLNIMQIRIHRSRMAGDPPELLITPRLGDFGLFDFDRADEAIEEGRRAVARALAPGAHGMGGSE